MGEAETYLSEVDAVMADLIALHGSCPLLHNETEPFCTLIRSIISQQLSAKAADTIERRIAKIVPMPFRPEDFLITPVQALRDAGLSTAKCRYIHEISARVCDGRLNFSEFSNHSDEAVIAALTEISGIGRWTAEMFLIFGLKRLDVLALGDAGLKRAAKMLYQDVDNESILEQKSAVWRPYRSIAAWYLWKHID